MVADDQMLIEVAVMHQRLRGIAQITAELQYIQEAQQLDGYGLEFYPVKVCVVYSSLLLFDW